MVSALYLLAAAALTSTAFAAPAATSDDLDNYPTSTWPATSKPTNFYELARVQEAQKYYIASICSPNVYNFTRDFETTEYTSEDLQAFGIKLMKSDFPCEQVLAIEEQCLPTVEYGDAATTPEEWKKEYECVCSNKLHELKAACANCQKVHGYDPEAADQLIKVASKIEQSVCSATAAPTTDYASLSTSIERAKENGCCTYSGTMMRFETGSDLFPSQTAVSHYYTSGAAIATGSITASGSAKATGTGMTTGGSTQASGTGANATATFAPATGGAAELKAAGGLVMAFLGVMAAL